MEPITIEGTYKGPEHNPRTGKGGWEAGEPKPTPKAPTPSTDSADAAKKAAELTRIKEAEAAARELLLRLNDLPLQNDSYLVGKALDRLKGLFINDIVLTTLKLLAPMEPGTDSWLDQAKTKEEMKGARRLLEKELEDSANAPKVKAENERILGLPVTPSPPLEQEIDNNESKKFFRSLASLAAAKSDDTAYVFNQFLTRGRRSSEYPLTNETLRTVSKSIGMFAPPNACIVNKRWACPMTGGTMGAQCMCPGIGAGRQGIRPMSEFCDGAVSKCRFNMSFPVGTACNCDEDFRIRGPIPYGNIVPRP